jgi:hypothetical protein
MADSGVITTPEAALERIMAVETPIRPGRLTGAAGVLPNVVTALLALLVLFSLATVVPLLLSGSGLNRPPTMMYQPR